MIGLLAGVGGKIVLAGVVAAVVIAGAWGWMRTHDARVLAERVAAEQGAIIEAQADQHRRSIQALELDMQAARDRADRLAAIKETIHAQPATRACVDAPAVRAALDGLRRASAASRDGAAPRGSSGAAGMPERP